MVFHFTLKNCVLCGLVKKHAVMYVQICTYMYISSIKSQKGVNAVITAFH